MLNGATEEVSLLLYINEYAQKKKYDLIILDCAPTGESLRFISIPTTLEWYMKKIFRLERSITRYARPLAKRIYNVPLPDDDYFASLEKLFGRLEGVDRLLTDPEVTSVRLVANPEKVVLKETQRAFMYFCLYKMKIDAVIMNPPLHTCNGADPGLGVVFVKAAARALKPGGRLLEHSRAAAFFEAPADQAAERFIAGELPS